MNQQIVQVLYLSTGQGATVGVFVDGKSVGLGARTTLYLSGPNWSDVVVSPQFVGFPSAALVPLADRWVQDTVPRYVPRAVRAYVPPPGWHVVRSYVDGGLAYVVIQDTPPVWADDWSEQPDTGAAPRPWTLDGAGPLPTPQVAYTSGACTGRGALAVSAAPGVNLRAVRWGPLAEWVTDPVSGLRWPSFADVSSGGQQLTGDDLAPGEYVVTAPGNLPRVVALGGCESCAVRIAGGAGDSGDLTAPGGAGGWALRGPRQFAQRRGLSGTEDARQRRQDGTTTFSTTEIQVDL